MSFDEIVEEVPKLSGEERDALRSYLDQYEAMENDAIDEGLRSLKEEPTITFEELDRRIFFHQPQLVPVFFPEMLFANVSSLLLPVLGS